MLMSVSTTRTTVANQRYRGLLDTVAGLLAGLFLLLVLSHPAAANPKFAAMAIDARTGKILYSINGDARRYPASLTKIMTLYLVFEDLTRGKITLNTRLRVSKYAAGRPPSKIGLKPGGSIRVKHAIGALVTKSANDVATVVAENLGGSESKFAARMTRKARELGMTRTTFRNASGLPNGSQVSTARDMATLALRIQRDFPKYYRYFSLRSYKIGRRRYGNHNRLLGRVKGVDGIKTGYIRASGFNLVTSARRGRKRVIAVVMGGKTGRSRNKYMTSLVNRMFRTNKLTSGTHLARLAGKPPGYKPKPNTRIAHTKMPLPLPRSKPSVDNIGIVVASAAERPAKIVDQLPKQTNLANAPHSSASLPIGDPKTPRANLSGKSDRLKVASVAKLPTPKIQVVAAAAAPATKPVTPKEADGDLGRHLKSWNIQVGAFPTATGAESRLEKAMETAAANLRGKKPFTMKFAKGGDVYYRARFSGFNRRTARKACRTLTRKGLGCFALAPRS